MGTGIMCQRDSAEAARGRYRHREVGTRDASHSGLLNRKLAADTIGESGVEHRRTPGSTSQVCADGGCGANACESLRAMNDFPVESAHDSAGTW